MAMDPFQPVMASTLDTASHDRIKAKTIAGYGGKDSNDLESGIDAMVDKLV
jgi:hypothetical protein